MNKRLLIMAALSLLPGIANAQAAFDSELDSELSAISSQPQEAQAAPTGAAIAPSGSANGQPIYILNQATPTANAQLQQTQTETQTQQAVQKQPQVDVVSSPLSKSRAEQIREARQQAEVETENKIVEKLEASRMEDERKRADALFGKPFENLSNQSQPQPQPVAQPAPAPVPVQVVQPVATPAPAPALDREAVREEIEAAMAMKAEVEAEEQQPIEQKYFSTNIGIGDYTDVRNVRGNYLLGATFGTKFDDTYAVEGSFIYSDYTVEPLFGGGNWHWGPNGHQWVPNTVDTKQYSGALTVKYFFLNGAIKPVLGGTAQYSYRTFGWSNNPWAGYGDSSEASSHAIDLGVVTGADLTFNKKWALGFEYRYMFNLASRVNTNNQSMFLTQPEYFGKPIEKLSYSMMSLVLRANF